MKRSPTFPRANLSPRMSHKLVLLIITAALLFPGPLLAQALKKVPFPFSPIGLNCLPWFVAKDARLSEKYGIDLDPIFIGASSALFQSMLSGAADFSGSGGPAIIANILSGGDVIHVTAMVPRFTQSVMVKPDIKRPEDMANKKIGVSRLGTVTHFALQTALDGYGVKNVTILQMGGQPEAYAGLARGSVVEKDRDTVIRVIKVTAEAIKLIQKDKEYTKKVIMKWMPMKDPDLLEQAYLFAAENYAKEGLVNEGALRSMVKQMVQSNLIDAKLAASTPITAYYDNRYVDEVKRSGFFDQLWR